jgi:hypothetical protein
LEPRMIATIKLKKVASDLFRRPNSYPSNTPSMGR